MTAIYVLVGIVLVVTALVVRDQTELKLSRLRAELLALRTRARRAGEEREKVERQVAQIGDALIRAERNQVEAEQSCEQVTALLEQVGIHLDPSETAGQEAIQEPEERDET